MQEYKDMSLQEQPHMPKVRHGLASCCRFTESHKRVEPWHGFVIHKKIHGLVPLHRTLKNPGVSKSEGGESARDLRVKGEMEMRNEFLQLCCVMRVLHAVEKWVGIPPHEQTLLE